MRENTIKHLDNMNRLANGEELTNKDYEYLDYCFVCDKPILPLEAFIHGFEGNCHRFGCSIFMRIFGFIYGLIRILVLLPIVVIGCPIYFIIRMFKKSEVEE